MAVCYGQYKSITLSWSRLNDWFKCRQRVKLYHLVDRDITSARGFLTGNLVDHSMRVALDNGKRDEYGFLQSLTMDELLAPLPEQWDKEVNKPDNKRVIKWKGDPRQDQKNVYAKATTALEELHPILSDMLIGRRYIPEYRPKSMPVVGIPGPDDETFYIRLYLAVDLAVQLEKGEYDRDTDHEGLGKWALYDLKTTEDPQYLNNTKPQLVFYDLAWKAATGEHPVDWGLIAPLVKGEKMIPVNVQDEARRSVMSAIIQYCNSIWAGDEDLTDDENHCWGCSVKSNCPKYKIPTVKDEKGISRISFGDMSRGGSIHG